MIIYNTNQYQKNNNIIMYSMEDGTILLNNDTQEVTVINELGAFIWDSIGDENSINTINEIVTAIKSVYDVTEEDDVNKEVNDFLLELIDKQILLVSVNTN